MNRRELLLVGGGAVAASLAPSRTLSRPVPPSGERLPLRDAAFEAWTYGLPLVEIASLRSVSMAMGGMPNRFHHVTTLATPTSRSVTAPNNDTLYSTTFLDLSGGPVTIRLPAAGRRYFSLALLDAYSNVFAVLGRRTIGDDGGEVTIVGPEQASPRGAVRSPTSWVWALGRTLVIGPDDLAAAVAVQAQLGVVSGPQVRASPRPVSRNAPWDRYFADLQALIDETPPPVTDTAFFARVAALGVGPGRSLWMAPALQG